MSKKVSLARIDKRLLHATVTLNWDPFIRVDYVAVVGSEYKNDPFTASVLQLCLPRTMKVKILKEEELMEFLELNEGPKAYRVLVIFKDLETARKLQMRSIEVVKIIIRYGGGVRGGKAIMNLIGIDCGSCRLPIAPFSDEEYKTLKEDLMKISFFDKK